MSGRGAIASLLVLLASGMTTEAGSLNPLDFPSLGAFAGTNGWYEIQTSSTPTLTGPGVSLLGLAYSDVPGHTIAVFDFSSFNLPAGAYLTVSGSYPVAILSQSDMTIAGTIDVSSSYSHGPAGSLPTNAGPGSYLDYSSIDAHILIETGGGGGGSGGAGEPAFSFPFVDPGTGFHQLIPGGAGGPPRGSLANRLEGGSDGYQAPRSGGGAVELGAVGNITVTTTGRIDADGFHPSLLQPGYAPGTGGGAGGGIFIHGQDVSIQGPLSAAGGPGGPTYVHGRGFVLGGGRGGGGRVVIQGQTLPDVDTALIDVSGYEQGVISIGIVPEPASAVQAVTALLAGLGLAWWRRGAAGLHSGYWA